MAYLTDADLEGSSPSRAPVSAPKATFSDADFAEPSASEQPSPSPSPSSPTPKATFSDADLEAPVLFGQDGSKNEKPRNLLTEDPIEATKKLWADSYIAAEKMATGTLHAIGAALEPLQIPMREAAGLVAKKIGMEVKDKPLAIYPFKAPDKQWSDIISYGAEKMDLDGGMVRLAESMGISPSKLLTASRVGVFGAGVLADLVGDPMMYIGVGMPNKASRLALESGKDIEKVTKSTIALVTPIRGKVIAEARIPIVNDTIQKGVDSVHRVFYNELDWRSGDRTLDAATGVWTNYKKGVPNVAQKEFAVPYKKANLSKEEVQVMTNLAETTPNLRPNLKGLSGNDKIHAGNAAAMTEAEIKAVGYSAEDVRKAIRERVAKAAEEEGIKLVPGREVVIEEMMMKAKEMNAKAIIAQETRGRIDYSKPLNEQFIENYSPHVKTPEAKKALAGKNSEEIREALEQGKLAEEADRVLNRGNLTSFSPFEKSRQLRVPVREANQKLATSGKTGAIMEEAGVNKFFQEDPFIASYENMIKKEQAALDHDFIQILNDRGFNYVEKSAGGEKLVRPRVEYGNQALLREMTLNQQKWVQSVESKMQHLIAPLESNGGRKFMESYNRAFRTSTLLKPSYYIQNFGDALAKNFIQGVAPTSYLNAAKAFFGVGSVKVNGKLMSAAELKTMMMKSNVINTAHTSEMVTAAILMGKRAASEGGGSFKKGNMFGRFYNNMQLMGSAGENWTRSAMFVDRLDRGYNVGQALLDVETFHFNFTRTTRAMDNLRLVFPFAQFPLKTLGIAGELALKRPGIYNQQQFLTQQIDRAMNDPMESAALKKLVPDYAKHVDRVPIGDAGWFMNGAKDLASDLIGEDSWVARSFLFPAPDKENLPQYQVYGKLPIGVDALNQWSLFEGEILKNGGFMSGPAYSFLQAMLEGKDAFTGANYDPREGKPDPGERLKAGAFKFAGSAVNFPNLTAIAMQEMGIGNDKFTTPAAVRIFNASFGGPNGFVDMYNTDRTFAIKSLIAQKQIDEQKKALTSVYLKEKAYGRANTSWMSGVPGTTAREIFNELLEMKPELKSFFKLANSYNNRPKGPLVDPKTKKEYANQELAKIIADLKGMYQSKKRLDENFVKVKERQIEAMKEEMAARKLSKQQVLDLHKQQAQEKYNLDRKDPAAEAPQEEGAPPTEEAEAPEQAEPADMEEPSDE